MKLDTVIAERKTKTIYRDGDRCIKVFNSTFSKADILNEALNNARVEDVGLYVPKILEVTTIDGKWAIVSEFIDRKILAADLDPVTRYELLIRLEGLPTHDKLCHGDFCPSNVLLTPDGKPYIIDWAHATQGNASADVARTYLTFHLSGDAATAEKYLNLFCDKSGTDKRYVQKWMPIVAASQSVKGNLEERDFLLSWTNVADYE